MTTDIDTGPCAEGNLANDHEADRALSEQLLQGSERAYNDFFADYFPRVLRFCAARLPAEEVEDVAMNVMNRIFRRLETYRGEASLYTWVCQVARSEIADHFRTKGRRLATVGIDSSEAVATEVATVKETAQKEPDLALEADEGARFLAQALDELPANYGDLLEAKYIEGLSMKEIAVRQRMTSKGVESALSRARKALKEKLLALNSEAASSVVGLRDSRSGRTLA